VSSTVNVIIRKESDSWGAWSPNAPGFFAAADTVAELRRMVSEGLRHWGDETHAPQPIDVRQHLERSVADSVVLRVADDAHRADRIEVAQRMEHALWVPEQLEAMEAEPVSESGEHVIIASVPDDTFAFIREQMTAEDCVIVAVAVADEMALTFYVRTRDRVDDGSEPVPPERTVGAAAAVLNIESPHAPRTFSMV